MIRIGSRVKFVYDTSGEYGSREGNQKNHDGLVGRVVGEAPGEGDTRLAVDFGVVTHNTHTCTGLTPEWTGYWILPTLLRNLDELTLPEGGDWE